MTLSANRMKPVVGRVAVAQEDVARAEVAQAVKVAHRPVDLVAPVVQEAREADRGDVAVSAGLVVFSGTAIISSRSWANRPRRRPGCCN